jgi:eukaryotic-like serine/threonine-protein kinase
VATSARDVWVCDVVRCVPTKLTSRGRNGSLIWSPDGKRLVYSSNIDGGAVNLYAANADGRGKPERLTTSDYDQAPSSWAATGQVIAFVETHSLNTQIWILPLEGDRKPRLLLESNFNLRYPDFSPDGHWLAYVSDESGTDEVYVQPYPSGEKHRISASGGQEPIWTANGRELLYRANTVDRLQFFSTAIQSLTPFRAATPRLLFDANRGDYGAITPVRGWDVSADGQQFLLTRSTESTEKPITEMNVVLNWAEELKTKVPTK